MSEDDRCEYGNLVSKYQCSLSGRIFRSENNEYLSSFELKFSIQVTTQWMRYSNINRHEAELALSPLHNTRVSKDLRVPDFAGE